ncbi:SDR family NAD(P)-dependent oxidoreductase [Sphingopyxis sp. MSC1_008]|jgi:3-oxoacyl-[acyl-carrier protein] reductase|nr:SDR family oxidoreductase [Sphingopyxis sp. MSC1_008]
MSDKAPGDVALVTGAARGLGAAIAEALHRDGMRVLVADVAVQGAREVARQLDPEGATARAISLDVRDKQSFVDVLARAADWGGIDVLVNNAAIAFTTPAMDIEGGEFDAVMAVNLRGPFFASQVIGAHLRAKGYGRIVNIASQAGQMGGTVTGGHYAASKAGLIGLTKYFAREFAGTGVTVNAVSPGPIDLPTVRSAVPADKLAALQASMPVRRLGEPREIADAVALLASRRMGYVTGATWDLNGGTLMR